MDKRTILLSFYITKAKGGERMKTFEIFSETKVKGQNGRRKFKVVLYTIYPDECIDTTNEVGTEYNLNGITWIREYCEQALPSIKGMFLRVEFLDEERTEICGHGHTDIIDGVPVFENATAIGTFTDGYIEEIVNDDGETILACIGEGEIDSSCYHNFCEKLDRDIANGIYPQGSVEILKAEDEEAIVYKYGYKEKGRIPMKFIHSGFALLGIQPADSNAKLLELNNKEETEMTDTEMKALIEEVVSAHTNSVAEINQVKEDCAKQISEMEEQVEAITAEKNEALESSEEIQKALDACKAEFAELDKKYSALCAEMDELRKELGEAKAKERKAELNSKIADFSETEKEYAKAEIEAFMANPMESEINSVVSKIYEGIGKTAKAEAEKKVAEQNAAKAQIEDIFSVVEAVATTTEEDVEIF